VRNFLNGLWIRQHEAAQFYALFENEDGAVPRTELATVLRKDERSPPAIEAAGQDPTHYDEER